MRCFASFSSGSCISNSALGSGSLLQYVVKSFFVVRTAEFEISFNQTNVQMF